MTIVPRRKPAPAARTSRRAPVRERFRPGREVAVYEDYSDELFAGRKGVVVSVCEDTDKIYPRGRVEVRLKIDELYEKLYRTKAPKTVWFKPNDLERL
jgi:hypothetical protein